MKLALVYAVRRVRRSPRLHTSQRQPRSAAAKGTAAAVVSALLLLAAGVGPARGASVTLIADMPAGEDWTNGARWSDGQPANSANDYFVGSGAGKILRSTNNAAAATFPGNSLQLDATAIFRIKPANPGTVTLPSLKLNGGTLHNGNGTNTTTVTGAVSVLTASNLDLSQMTNNAFNSGGDTTRTLIVSASIAGPAQLSIGNGNTAALPNTTNIPTYGRVETTNPANAFTGGWNVISGALRGVAPGSLGMGSISVGAAGGFDTDYDLILPTASFTLNGLMQLDQNDTFGAISINGTALTPGTYTASQLTTQFPNNFFPGGTGSLTVAAVPEPGCLSTLVVPAGILLASRKRGAARCGRVDPASGRGD